MRAEMVLRVNSEVFRAVGQVLDLRDRFGVGMEFLQLTTGGRESLQDLIRRLERLQAHLNQMKSAREEDQQEILMQEIDQGLKRYLLGGHIPLIRTILPAEKPEVESHETPRPQPVVDDAEEVTSVDIFI